MIERKAVLAQPELNRSGFLCVKIAKLLVEDGTELDCQWHRTSIPIAGDAAAQMAAVNESLAALGYNQLPQSDVETVIKCHELLAVWVVDKAGPTKVDPAPSKRPAEIAARLTQIDAESVRPLRAKVAGTAIENDESRLKALDAEAASLRVELAGIAS